jgi:hypothetical protein
MPSPAFGVDTAPFVRTLRLTVAIAYHRLSAAGHLRGSEPNLATRLLERNKDIRDTDR